MRLRNFYIFFPIVVSVFILFVLKYKFQNLFLSKYIISQKELSKKISNYVQNQTQSFLIFLSKNFYFFKDKLKVIWDSFKVLEGHFSKNSYKTFRFSNNESQIYGLLSDKVLYGIFNADNNSVYFSFFVNKTKFKPFFKVYFLKKDLDTFVTYQSNDTSFILYKSNNTFLIKDQNSTYCYVLEKGLRSINCTPLEDKFLKLENLYEKLKYKFFKLLGDIGK